MTENDKQHFENLLIKAIQSGKSETSGLVSDIKKDIAELKSNYSKREIDHFMSEIKENTLKILEQTTRHNGRMVKIESELGMGTDEPTKLSTLSENVSTLKTDRTRLWTVFSVVGVIGASVLGLSLYSLKAYVNESVEQALQDNVSAVYYEK